MEEKRERKLKNKIIVVAGPTAVGKTEYAIKIAQETNGEIVSCDSMQLYKHMDIGSAKPSEDQLAIVKHHLIGTVDPLQPFSAAVYQQMAKKAINEIFKRGKTPVITGGTGLYLNSLIYEMDFGTPPEDKAYRKQLENIAKNNGPAALHDRLRKKDPEAAKRIHPNNIKRVIRALEAAEKGEALSDFSEIKKKTDDYGTIMIGLMRNRNELYHRINSRVELIVSRGLLNEVEGLVAMGLTSKDISMKGIGYKEIIDHLNGAYDLEEAIDLIKKNTRHYAKRQITWFKRYEDMKWFDLSAFSSEQEALEDILLWVFKNR